MVPYPFVCAELSRPKLPAAVTTTIPALHAASTAWIRVQFCSQLVDLDVCVYRDRGHGHRPPFSGKRFVTARICLGSTHVSLGYRIGIEEVAPARELATTHSEQVEEIGLASLARGLDAQIDVPGDDHSFTLSDELLNV